MLQGIGKRGGNRPETVLARMESCHGRIRHFLAVAVDMARGEHPEAEVRDAAASISRYFAVGFVQHVRDEEDHILPKLDSPGLTSQLCDEHGRDDADIASLVSITEALSYDPGSPALKDELAGVLSRLGPNMEAHLAHEERVMFPLIAALSEVDERAVFEAMETSRENRRGQRS
ncbi:MAG: hemerythrin domain-containing protein [Myxococcales bacterium]|nr:hemerythrin domain-containing protein [Myxococcales bacterium]